MDLNSFEEVCEENKLDKMSIPGKYLTFITHDRMEGIEYRAGNAKQFWFKEGQRIYDEPASDRITKILQLFANPEKKKEDTIQTEKAENTIINDGKIINNLPAIFEGKRIIVPSDIEELKKMSTFDRILLFQKTHPSIIKEKNGRGGKQKYVEGNIMKLEANIAFLFQISSKIEGWQIDDKGVSCYGSIKVNIDGKETIVSDVGSDLQEYRKEDKTPVFTVHELMKNACTDMKKRCLASVGFNGDVYRGEV